MKASYISFFTFTDQGARAIKQSPQRAAAFRQQAEAAGVKVVAQLWTAGDYDGILILEGNDEQKVLSLIAQLAAAGNVRPHSLRAFDAAEFAGIVGA